MESRDAAFAIVPDPASSSVYKGGRPRQFSGKSIQSSIMATPSRRIVSPPPNTQGLSCRTFRPPILDGSLQYGEFFDWHEKYSPSHRLFVYIDGESHLQTITWSMAARAIRAAAQLSRNYVQWNHQTGKAPVVAILAASDSIPYATMVMGIIRASFVAFPISVRNSPAAVAHLLNKVGVAHILVGREQSSQDLVQDAIAILKTQNTGAIEPCFSPIPVYEDIYSPSFGPPNADELPYVFYGPDAPILISHSSGSTAFPKPIVFSNSRMIEFSASPYYGERDLTDLLLSIHPLPMFHAMGLMNLVWTSACGYACAAFAPQSPPPVPTPELVARAAQAADCDVIVTVPAFLETWSRNMDYVRWLSTADFVLFGGGPLNKEVGSYLISQGVPLINGYGLTEVGIVSLFMPAKPHNEWEYIQLHTSLTIHMEPQGDNTFELVVVINEKDHPCLINTKVNGVDAYATSDRISPHPTLPGYWKITNPGPLESTMMQDEHVSGCVMFGRGRFQAGILIEPKPEYVFDPTDEVKLAEYRNLIWPTVEKMNTYAPQHSRLFKEMIIIASPAKPFEYTPKSTIRRAAVIAKYDDEINVAYDRVEESSQSSIPAPIQWESENVLPFVRAIVNKVMKHDVMDEDDLFHHGCDSLQATWIRNTLLRVLRDTTKVNTRKIVGNFVYEHPTIAALVRFIVSTAHGTAQSVTDDVTTRVDAMHAMVVKYTRDFPKHQGSTMIQGGEVVLLTGSTGSIGCYVLAQLLSDPKVSRVYAINRASRDHVPLRRRQRCAFIDRGLPDLITSEKLTLVEGNLEEDKFDVPADLYEEMCSSVTHIVHNAWRVDFNVALTSFESNVRGVRRLIDFALSTPFAKPPQVLFTSSVGVFQNARKGDDLSEAPIKADYAVGTGYAESKWVSERILYEAAARTPVDTMVVRVGQVTGGLDGAWNLQEWFPSMVQSASRLGCFPDDDRDVAWIPLEVVAAAVADLRRASCPTRTVHLVHPRPVSWNTIAVVIGTRFGIPLVPYARWLARLERITQATHEESSGEQATSRSLRVLQLLPMFKAIGASLQSGTMALGFHDIPASRALEASPTLADPELRQLGEEDVQRWLAYWQRAGLFGPSDRQLDGPSRDTRPN
ncbi:uncharacterized protein FIBRA_02808 [Fibroporia radiculosa]|uniref:Polyketide synthase phosphopantetheine-binding domain-containing protein n=1 Tax=Fibroporia radiculosa TaxID=599839 RepID=J4HVI7_9APHY|nr:uncharacterized protein FIBRA_02808 [Fibroporia radiculosa]CCM00767.1 predicted protein [Fibroporia radiculosa]